MHLNYIVEQGEGYIEPLRFFLGLDNQEIFMETVGFPRIRLNKKYSWYSLVNYRKGRNMLPRIWLAKKYSWKSLVNYRKGMKLLPRIRVIKDFMWFGFV